MAVINYNKKFIYLFEPHTASRAALEALKSFVPHTAEVGHHHIGVPELTDRRRQHIDTRRINRFKIICSVRNPFDTLVTQWRISPQFRTDSGIDRYIDALEHVGVLYPAKGLYKEASQFCWYENLENDLQWTFTAPSLELKYDKTHRSPGKKHWQTYYTPKLIRRLKKVPEWDDYLNRFGYNINDDGSIVEFDENITSKLCQPIP